MGDFEQRHCERIGHRILPLNRDGGARSRIPLRIAGCPRWALSPPEPDGLVFWAWNALAGLAYSQGQPITQWDAFKNALDMSNTTAAQEPIYEDGTNTINGLPAVHFAEAGGAADWLSTSDDGSPSLGGQPFTLVQAMQVLVVDSTVRDFASFLAGPSARVADAATFTAPNNQWSGIAPSIGADAGLVITTGLHLVAVVFNGVSSIMYVDGVAATVDVGANAPTGPLRFGAGSAAILGCRSYLHEGWLYDGALSIPELDQWRVYSAAQWGTP